jgi:hypothetical protein
MYPPYTTVDIGIDLQQYHRVVTELIMKYELETTLIFIVRTSKRP